MRLEIVLGICLFAGVASAERTRAKRVTVEATLDFVYAQDGLGSSEHEGCHNDAHGETTRRTRIAGRVPGKLSFSDDGDLPDGTPSSSFGFAGDPRRGVARLLVEAQAPLGREHRDLDATRAVVEFDFHSKAGSDDVTATGSIKLEGNGTIRHQVTKPCPNNNDHSMDRVEGPYREHFEALRELAYRSGALDAMPAMARPANLSGSFTMSGKQLRAALLAGQPFTVTGAGTFVETFDDAYAGHSTVTTRIDLVLRVEEKPELEAALFVTKALGEKIEGPPPCAQLAKYKQLAPLHAAAAAAKGAETPGDPRLALADYVVTQIYGRSSKEIKLELSTAPHAVDWAELDAPDPKSADQRWPLVVHADAFTDLSPADFVATMGHELIHYQERTRAMDKKGIHFTAIQKIVDALLEVEAYSWETGQKGFSWDGPASPVGCLEVKEADEAKKGLDCYEWKAERAIENRIVNETDDQAADDLALWLARNPWTKAMWLGKHADWRKTHVPDRPECAGY